MKKIKLKSLFLALILIMSVSFPVYAQNEGNDITVAPQQELIGYSETTFNEYELLRQLNAEYNKAKKNNLLTSGKFNSFSEDELLAIDNYKQEYSNKIYELKKWEIESLKAVGYTDEQIKAIKAFDGSEEMMILAATTVKVGAGFRNLVRNSTGTTVDLIVDFNAQGIASNNYKDIFAVVWSPPLTVVSTEGTLRYVNDLNKNYYEYPTPAASGVYARDIKFKKYSGTGLHPYYIHSGSMIISLRSNTKIYDFAAYAAYGYTSISINPSVSYPGGLAITFSVGTTTAGSAYASL